MTYPYHEKIKCVLTENIIEKLKACKRKYAPIEACGLIFGDVKKVDIIENDFQIHYIAKEFYCLKSNLESMGAFKLVNSEEFGDVIYDAVEINKLRPIGIFHSHPIPAYPSSVDVANMEYLDKFQVGGVKNPLRNQIWVIMSMEDETINGFIYFNGVYRVELLIKSD
ncbi:MAG: Mov34/MPN/PAD-1 family protein [Promethearchaeia archaeon]